jgi:hypothetical protein
MQSHMNLHFGKSKNTSDNRKNENDGNVV